ncbi:MAG TPA: hypothetical protein DFR83_08470, partial [Deltaproteobacteria bacterium]|nr:hypothetical protein [Deltaproteobacteria bacterium]
MKQVLALLMLCSALFGCRDNEFVCVDKIAAGEGLTDNMDDFIGMEVCYYSFADDKGCEDEGGTAHVMGDYGWTKTCADLGYSVECGGSASVQDGAECPADEALT